MTSSDTCIHILCAIHQTSVGWVSKAVLFPLMKACFANSLNETEIKTLLTSTALMSLVRG